MSHQHEHKEKNCLNCGARLYGKYCQNCSQQNNPSKQSFWHLLVHLFSDLTHFDGKVWTTAKWLVLKPGFLSVEYMEGRRVRYMDPLRMYLFVSASFFILFLILKKPHTPITKQTHPEIVHFIDSVRGDYNSKNIDTMITAVVNSATVYIYIYRDQLRHGIKYYDSLQRALPRSKRNGYLTRFWAEREIAAFNAYDKDPYNKNYGFWGNIYKSLSKAIFFSLPLFSFMLYLLYYKRRKELFFTSHAVFSLHFYILIWFFLLAGIIFLQLKPGFNKTPVTVTVFMGLLIYLYVSMRRFYKQGWFKTLYKMILLFAVSFAFLVGEMMLIWLDTYGYF